MNTESKRVLLALSGGVDSSTAGELLKREGYYVEGLFMMMSDSHKESADLAKAVADSLNIKLNILDLREEFKKVIIDYFAAEYKQGKTPSPCIRCNPKIKFKYLLKFAIDNGFDFIATGHYAKIINDNGIYKLCRSKNDSRDQSYMLFGLGQDVLSRLIFPIAEMDKSDVRKMASDIKLISANSPDSQENCFIPDNDYAKFIEENYGESPKGEFISPDGKVCGTHKGILHYTVGQRKGLGVALGRPAFITKIDALNNKIYLGFECEMVREVKLVDINETYPNALKGEFKAYAKLRSAGSLMECVVIPGENENERLLKFDRPFKKVSDGQGGVIYLNDTVLGGGIIENIN